MKSIQLLFLLLAFSIVTRAQLPAGIVAPEDAAFNTLYTTRTIPVIHGKLLNKSAATAKDLAITYTIVVPFWNSQVKKTTTVQSDGSFTLQLDYPLPYQQVWFELGDIFYAGLYADKELYLELDVKKLKAAKEVNFNGDGVRYGGVDGPLNTYINNYYLYQEDDRMRLNETISDLISHRLPTNDFIGDYNRLFDSLKIHQDHFKAANPSAYEWALQNETQSEYYGRLCIWYYGRTMPDSLWQQVSQHKSYFISNSSAEYYNYIIMYMQGLLTDTVVSSSGKGITMNPIDKRIRLVDSLFSPAKADYLKFRLNTNEDILDKKETQERVLNSLHTSWCTSLLKKEQQATIKKVNEINKALTEAPKGKKNTALGKAMLETSFGASLYKVAGIKTVDLLAKLKQSYPGKAILIDRWATWCSPCLAEMPYSKKLQQEAGNLPVVFVYLCTLSGSTESKWKTKVAELQQPGIHILIDEALDVELSTYFSFKGYPGYAFINKQGIYQPGAITWPSQIKGKEELATLVNK